MVLMSDYQSPLRQRGWRVDLLPSEANAAGLVDAFASEGFAAGELLAVGSFLHSARYTRIQ